MPWHPEAIRYPIRSKLGLVLKGSTHVAPVTKALLHTTEGTSAESAFAAYNARRSLFSGIHPHFTLEPWSGRLFQHIDTDRASYAIKGYDRAGIIQIEVVGKAKYAPTWLPHELKTVAELLGWIFDNHPGVNRFNHPEFLGSDRYLAAPWPYGAARMSPATFEAFSGTVGHQHAPADDHWDPGAIDIDYILRRATPTQGDDDMFMIEDSDSGQYRIGVTGLGITDWLDPVPQADGSTSADYWRSVVSNGRSSGVYSSKYMSDLLPKLR